MVLVVGGLYYSDFQKLFNFVWKKLKRKRGREGGKGGWGGELEQESERKSKKGKRQPAALV